jgi:hypothetical protein
MNGIFGGLFKNKSQYRYFPITRVHVNEIIRTGDNWSNTSVDIGNSFIGLAANHIEAYTFGSPEDMPHQ